MRYSFVLMGRSGCGKGTQVALLKKYLESIDPTPILHIETGPMFRDFILGSNFSNVRSRELYDNDDLQPSFLGCYMWSKAVIDSVTGKEHLIFDGVARTIEEAHTLGTALSFYKLDKNFVIELNVSRTWSEKHLLSRGRADDASIERIDKRLNWFEKDTVKAIDYYKNSGEYSFVTVNGEQPVEKVHEDILSFIAPLLSK
jgi:adenylate kinase